MSGFLDNLVHPEPHSFAEIQESLDAAAANNTSYLTLLKEHHDYLKESIKVLMDPDASDADKKIHTLRFFKLVEMHGKAEEETLYVHLRLNDQKEARLEGYGGQDEHDVAFQLEQEVLDMGLQEGWSEEIAAKVKVAAGLVLNHIKEEEGTMFSVAEKDLGEDELEGMQIDYIQKCRTYLNTDSPTLEPRRMSLGGPANENRVR